MFNIYFGSVVIAIFCYICLSWTWFVTICLGLLLFLWLRLTKTHSPTEGPIPPPLPSATAPTTIEPPPPIPPESTSKMDTLIGVLVDVSGSMKQSIGEKPDQKLDKKASSWARSIFKVVDGLIKHDVSSANHVFALAFGANKEPYIFDLLGTVAANTKPLPLPYKDRKKAEIVQELLQMIRNEIRPTPRWANVEDLMKVLTKSDAFLFLEELKHNSDFKRNFKSQALGHRNVPNPMLNSLYYPQEFGNWNAADSFLLPRMTGTDVDNATEAIIKSVLKEILDFLEKNGAPRVRTWANMEILLQVVEISLAFSLLDELRHNSTFKGRFVQECLPETCRTVVHTASSYAVETFHFASHYIPNTRHEEATRESIEKVVAKGKTLLSDLNPLKLAPINHESVMDVHKASDILHGGIGEEELTDERVDELMDAVEPLIYGGTPLMTTIDVAKVLFAMPTFKDHKKLMFIISDGQPGDGDNPPIEELAQMGVTTVCCYITKDPIDNPKHLFSTPCYTWDIAAELMFRMSSTITTQKIPRTIFVKRGWSVDFTDNETRLFAQVNHPDIIDDVCDLARDVVCCQDALSDVLTTVSLDLYINQANQGFVPKKQVGGTCYANASAAVLHLSMQRIIGRDGGYPDFFELRKKMIKQYGERGRNTLEVLQKICPEYRLHCKEVNSLGAMGAITAKRPVVARFWLTEGEWDTFDVFYELNPRGVLKSADLDIKQRPPGAELKGHAVVLTSFNSEGLRLMSSWGSQWADGGFFKVSNAEVLGLQFIDVFWTLKDLKQSEIDAYKRDGTRVAQELFSKLQGLQKAQYPCPLCRRCSNVADFWGHHLQAQCPKCHDKFKMKDAGDDLALNMYLLSLSAGGEKGKSNKNKEREHLDECCIES